MGAKYEWAINQNFTVYAKKCLQKIVKSLVKKFTLEYYINFTIFRSFSGILFKGNPHKTSVVLDKFKPLDHEFLVDIGHKVELILMKECPMMIPKMRSLNLDVTWIVSQWYRQYFLNVLDWKDIIAFILLLVQNGPNYAILVFVIVFKHLKPKILQDVETKQDLDLVLKSDPINFDLCNYLSIIHDLSNRYQRFL